MNKKVIIGIVCAVVLVAAIVIGIFVFGGEKLQEVTLSVDIDFGGETQIASANVGYPQNAGIELQEGRSESDKVFKNKDKNYKLEVSIVDELESTYDENAETDKKEEGYQEVTYNGYNGYILKGEYRVEGKLLLDNDESNINKVFEFTVEPIESYQNDDFVNPEPLYNLKEVRTILKSVKYNGTITVDNMNDTDDVDNTTKEAE